jgi:hypothetical protein
MIVNSRDSKCLRANNIKHDIIRYQLKCSTLRECSDRMALKLSMILCGGASVREKRKVSYGESGPLISVYREWSKKT